MAGVQTINPHYTGPLIIESYLKKLKKTGGRALFTSKFTKRWFVLDLRSGSFHYLANKNKSKPEKTYALTDIMSVDINPKVTEVCDWKFSFVVETVDRSYFLYAESVSMHTLWCTALLAVIKVNAPGPLEESESRRDPRLDDRVAYDNYQGQGEGQRDYDRRPDPQMREYDAEPNPPQLDPEGRTPSPVQEDPEQRQYQQPGNPPPRQSEYQPAPMQQYQSEQDQQYQSVPVSQSRPVPESQYHQGPDPQYNPPPLEQFPPTDSQPAPVQYVPAEPQRGPDPIPSSDTFQRVEEYREPTEPIQPKPRPQAKEPESDEFSITTPSRFSEGRKGPMVGESSYKGPSQRESQPKSIWVPKAMETDSVIQVEKITSEIGGKEDSKRIKRDRMVRKEPKAAEEVKVVAKPQEKPLPRLAPENKTPTTSIPTAGLKESLSLGKGGFTDILDEMQNLGLPPPDQDQGKSIWGGVSKQAKEKTSKPASFPRPETQSIPPPVQQVSRFQPEPVYDPSPDPVSSIPKRISLGEAPGPAPYESTPTYQEKPVRHSERSVSYIEKPSTYSERPVYQEPAQSKPVVQARPAKYLEKPEVKHQPQNYDDWDEETQPTDTKPIKSEQNPEGQGKKGKLNWDDWDQE